MSTLKVIIVRPNIYDFNGNQLPLGEQDVEKSLAEKLIERGYAEVKGQQEVIPAKKPTRTRKKKKEDIQDADIVE